MADIGIKLGVEGEKEFKSALADINRELKVSASEVTKLAAKYDSTDKSVAATTERQKALEAQLAKQKEAVKTISEALENAKNSFGEADKRTLEWQKKLNDAEAAVYKTEKAIKENNSATEEQKKKLEEAKKKLGEYAKAAEEKAAKALKALSAAAAGAVTAVSALVLKAGSAADELSDMSKVTGLTTTQLQKYDYTAKMAGTTLETITGAQTKLTKQMAAAKDESSAAAKKFDALGVSVKGTNGELRSSDDVFIDVIDALGKIDNEAERDAAAMDIFGKSAKELNPLILEGADGLREYAKQAEELGVIVSEDNVAALADMQGKVKEVTAQFDALKQNLAAKFAPIAREVLEKVQTVIANVAKQLDSPKFKASIDKLGEALKKFLDKAAELAEKVLPHLVEAAAFVIENFDTLAISIGSVWAALKGVEVVRGAASALGALKTTLTSLTASASAAGTAIEGANGAIGASAAGAGAAAASVGALVTAFVAVQLAIFHMYDDEKNAIKDVTKESELLTAQIKNIYDSSKEARSAFDANVRATEAAAESAKEYLTRMEELEDQGKLTADEQKEYNALVLKLKAAMPGLNTDINKQTGFLEKGAKALKSQVDELAKKAKAAAYEQLLTDEYKRQFEYEQKLKEATENRKKKEQEYLEFEERKARRLEEISNATVYSESYAQERQKWAEETTLWQEALDAAQKTYVAAEQGYAKSVETVGALADEYSEFASTVEETTEVVDDNTEKVDESTKALEEHRLKVKDLVENHYKKLVDAATDIFKKIDETTELSMEKIVDTLKHNRDALLRYEENMRIIAERGASQAALEYLDSLGVEQAGVIDLIAKSTDEEFAEFMRTFDGNINIAKNSARSWGRAVGDGIVGGMKEKESEVEKAAKRLAQRAEKGFTTTLEIKSPSRVFYRDTLNVGRAVELSLRDSAAEVEKASGYLARSLESGFDPSVAAPLALSPHMGGTPAIPGTPGTGNTYNYYVSDPSPAFYEAVMQGVNQRFGGLYA